MCNVGQEVEELQRGSSATLPTLESVKADCRDRIRTLPVVLKPYWERRDACISLIQASYEFSEMCELMKSIPKETQYGHAASRVYEDSDIETAIARFIGGYLYSEIIEEETD